MAVPSFESKPLKLYEKEKKAWEHEVIKKVHDPGGPASAYWFTNACFWLIEPEADGHIKFVDTKIGEEGAGEGQASAQVQNHQLRPFESRIYAEGSERTWDLNVLHEREPNTHS